MNVRARFRRLATAAAPAALVAALDIGAPAHAQTYGFVTMQPGTLNNSSGAAIERVMQQKAFMHTRIQPTAGESALLPLIKGPGPDSGRDAVIEHSVRVSTIIGSPRYPVSEERLRADATEGYERCYYPQGIARHLGAVLGSGSLRRYNKQTLAPTVVLHGREDKLMRPSGGRAIAAAIPGARLVLFDGMGHDLPEGLWDDLVSELTKTFSDAQ